MDKRKVLRIERELEMALIGKVCSPDEGVYCFDNWLQEHGSKFVEIFRKKVESEPELLERWEVDSYSITERFASELA